MSTSKKRDPGWQYGVANPKDSNAVTCNFCGIITNGGILRLKKHLAGGYIDASKCPKCPPEVSQEMKTCIETMKLEKGENIRSKKEDTMLLLIEDINLATELERQALEDKAFVENKIKEGELLLKESRKESKELEDFLDSRLKKFIQSHVESVQELKAAYESTKKQALTAKEICNEEIDGCGLEVKRLLHAAKNYDGLLAEKDSNLLVKYDKVFTNDLYLLECGVQNLSDCESTL